MKPQLFQSLKTYKKRDIIGDLLAGLMVAIIALPLSMALGIQTVPESLPINGIQMGIITAIIAGFFISFLGGSKFQIGGPTAAFVAILYGYLADPEIGLYGVIIAGVIAGVVLILMGVLKLGRVMKFFPYPITIGFTTGIGLTLIIGQIKDLCGLSGQAGAEAIEKISSYVQNIASFHLPTFFVGLIGFAIVFFLPKISKKIPAAFVAIIVCTLLTLLLNNVWSLNVATIGSRYGKITAKFNIIDFSAFTSIKIGKLIMPAIIIAFLCAIESLLSATVASGMTGTTFDANQELIGQGVANIFSLFFGGLPATGAIARTVAGIENGAKSPLTGVFHALFMLIMYFLLMGVVQFIPMAVFASILMGVAINMSRFKLFFKLFKFGGKDVAVLIFSCIITVALDLTYGVIGGLILALILNIKSFANPVKIQIDEATKVVTVSGCLFFGNANKLIDLISKELGDQKELVLDFSKVISIDQTALEKLIRFNASLVSQNKKITITNCNSKTDSRIQQFFNVI